MTPRERADRLFDRIMRLDTEGKKDSVQFFAPMAISAVPDDPRPGRRRAIRHGTHRRGRGGTPRGEERGGQHSRQAAHASARPRPRDAGGARQRRLRRRSGVSREASRVRKIRVGEEASRIRSPHRRHPRRARNAASDSRSPAHDSSPLAMPTTTIRVAHSPDSDDAFMFYALAEGKIDTGDLRYVHELQDIESLNQRALQGRARGHRRSRFTRTPISPTGTRCCRTARRWATATARGSSRARRCRARTCAASASPCPDRSPPRISRSGCTSRTSSR